MYLSKLTFSNHLIGARRLIASPYQLHKAVMRAFLDADNGGPGRVLFRVDHSDNSDPAYLLVQSEKKPDWQKAEQLLGCMALPPESKHLDLKFNKGQVLYFRLQANPTIKRKMGDNKASKRLGLLREEDQLTWLKRKAEEGGFSILSCVTTTKEMLGETKIDNETKHKLSLLSIRFEGVLKVEDSGAFLETVRSGIGSAKGLGFGLLSLAPIRG